MRIRQQATLCWVLLLASCAKPETTGYAVPLPANMRAIVIANESQGSVAARLLDLIRRRLPLVVREGRFSSIDGMTNTCVHARRSSARGELALARTHGFVACASIAVFVDGIGISDAGSFLARARTAEFESVELVSGADAMHRFGLAADGGEVLVLWTRGRGPHASPGRR